MAKQMTTMKTICFINQKGGVGKTTTMTTTAKLLADSGYRVLAVDLDQQGNAGRGSFNIETDGKETVFEVIKGEAEIENAIQRSYTLPSTKRRGGKKITVPPQDRGVDVLASDSALANLTLEGGALPVVHVRLKRALDKVRERYDFCLIDCPPAIGYEWMMALTASDYVVILSEASYFSTDGMITLHNRLKEAQEWYNPNVKPLGILVTLFNERTRFSKKIEQDLTSLAENLGTFVYDTKIRSTVKVKEAQDEGLTIVEYAPESTASLDYKAYFEQFLAKVGQEGAR